MRKELFTSIKQQLSRLRVNASGEYTMAEDSSCCADLMPAVRHIDLWNRNVEFIEDEEAWPRPAVFIEIEPVCWTGIVPGLEYRAEARVRLHIVTDWAGTADGPFGAVSMLELPDHIHDALGGLCGDTFRELTLEESHTNHNHGDIVENIEVYGFTAIKRAGR